MTEQNDRRENPDRRKTKNKNFPNNQRNTVRRKEDMQNNTAYYLALLTSFMIIATFFCLSILNQK